MAPVGAAQLKSSPTAWPYLLLASAAAAFVWVTGRSLPAFSAVHFGASGVANGYMQRASYLQIMLLFVVLLPLAMNLVMSRSLRGAQARINLPDRDYWLAPERREATIASLLRRMQVFGALLIVFLCHVHWLVVQANRAAPPVLDSTRFVGGLAVFTVATVIWLVALRRSFRRPRV
jgi:uncharacterized membrane protein